MKLTKCDISLATFKITLIIIVGLLLIMLAEYLGDAVCKEPVHEQEVEFVEPNEYSFECKIHGKVEALRYHDGFKMHKYCKRCYGEFLNRHLPAISCPEPNDPDIFTNALHPTCPDYTEPNEPAKNLHEAYTRWSDAQGYITDNFGNTTPMFVTGNEPYEPDIETADFSVTPAPFMEWELCEPNEPEYTTFSIPDTDILTVNSEGEISINIPTWPDYIELEKDLVVVTPTGRKVSGYKESKVNVIYPKGTRIYFK